MGQTVFSEVVLQPLKAFRDNRGYFIELYRESNFAPAGQLANARSNLGGQANCTAVPEKEHSCAPTGLASQTAEALGGPAGHDTAAVFVQDNFSVSKQGVLRGLHYQRCSPQGKLVQVLAGKVFDVVVDVRQGSPRFGRWQGFVLDAAQPSQLWVPPGFAHGFAVLSAEAALLYKCTRYYQPEDEVTLRWDDPEVAIDWPLRQPVLSAKDGAGLSLAQIRQQGLAIAAPIT